MDVVDHEPKEGSLFREDGRDLAMANRPSVANCPPGLEYLTQIDQLIYKQTVHLIEAFCPLEKNNIFHIYNSMGQQVYTAKEDTSCAMRYFCGAARGFVYRITDTENKEVMTITRNFKCCAGCCWCANADCCAFEAEIQSSTGDTLGFVRQMQSCWKPRLGLFTPEHEMIGMFKGPCCVCNCCCCGDVEFPLIAMDDETVIGKVSKQWSGAAREMFTDADNFCCTFPIDMDVKSKATIFGATFLVDMMFFQKDS